MKVFLVMLAFGNGEITMNTQQFDSVSSCENVRHAIVSTVKEDMSHLHLLSSNFGQGYRFNSECVVDI